MGKCALCSKSGEGLSLLGANHKELGHIMVCQDCWVRLYQENYMVASSGGSGGCSCGR